MQNLLHLVLVAVTQPGDGQQVPFEPSPASEPAESGEPIAGPRDPKQEYGPFFERPAPSDTVFPTQPRGAVPRLSVGGGSFCFVEDAACKSALLVSAQAGIGLRVIGENGPDLPFSQFTVAVGFTVKPLYWAKHSWNPWAVGLTGSWSIGTGGIRTSVNDDLFIDRDQRTDSWRIALINQLWLSQKPHAFHLDFSLGAVRSEVLGSGRVFQLWGTHAEFAVGLGGWGALFASGDFLDEDTRVVFGFRLHGIAAAPVIGLVTAGMAAGGAL